MFTTKTALTFCMIVSPIVAETILGVTVFTRHGDRNTKHYKAQQLTNLGFEQNYRVGASYRDLYLVPGSPKQILGISPNKHVPSQIYASAPDQKILLNTATAFLQGLYPPVGTIDVAANSEPLNNGSSSSPPLDGYQYITLQGINVNSPDTVWLKGADSCPAVTSAAATFANSTEFKSKLTSTKDFYASFWPLLSTVYDYTREKMTYANAYDIFDLINVALVHNSSFPSANITSEQLFQLRTLGDGAEFSTNFNVSQPARSIGGQTFSAAVLRQLNQTVASKGNLKFSLLSGSYNTFLSFFGLTNLTAVNSNFYGLPHYASTMAFELFTPGNQTSFPSDVSKINVRFLFRNGSDSTASLTPYPLFGKSSAEMSWTDFQAEMKARAIMSTSDWCKACGNTDGFCLSNTIKTTGTSDRSNKSGSMSNTIAGVIGAMVTLGFLAICGVLVFFVLRRRTSKVAPVVPPAEDTGSMSSGQLYPSNKSEQV